MTRLATITAALALLLCLTATGAPISANASTGQRDIVVIMVDDLGAMGGCSYRRLLNRLPNIRSLFIEDGLCFDQYFNESPLCCPGRAAFLTGQHTRRHGVRNNNMGYAMDDSRTIATAFDDVGYRTVQIGKYFNHSFSFDDVTPDGWDRVLMSEWRYWRLNGGPAVDLGYVDRQVARFAVAEAQAAPQGEPLFMWLNPLAPHCRNCGKNPVLPRIEPRYADDPRCDGIPPYHPPDYAWAERPSGYPLGSKCRALLTVDDMVGSLRSTMARLGRNPVWVFTSDNGMAWGRKGWPSKDTPESTRTPLYIAGPGIGAGRSHALLSNIDLPVTLASLAGASMPWADGLSFAAALDGSGGGRSWMLEEHWRYRGTDQHWQGIRTHDWHLIERDGAQPLLYDLSADPWEQDNLAGRRLDVVAELQAHQP